MYTRGMGAAGVDPLFPAGCPSGFKLTQMFQSAPNAQGDGVTFNFLGQGTATVPAQWSCVNTAGAGPFQVAQSACGPDWVSYGLLGAGLVSLFALPGWSKLLALGLVGGGLLEGFGYHMQALQNTDGSISCRRAVTSW